MSVPLAEIVPLAEQRVDPRLGDWCSPSPSFCSNSSQRNQTPRINRLYIQRWWINLNPSEPNVEKETKCSDILAPIILESNQNPNLNSTESITLAFSKWEGEEGGVGGKTCRQLGSLPGPISILNITSIIPLGGRTLKLKISSPAEFVITLVTFSWCRARVALICDLQLSDSSEGSLLTRHRFNWYWSK